MRSHLDIALHPNFARNQLVYLPYSNPAASVREDNPFVGKAGYRPEIYTMGNRNAIGLTIHPVTGQISRKAR